MLQRGIPTSNPLTYLMKQEYCVSELAKKIELRIARLVRFRKDGKKVFYSIQDEQFNGFLKKLMRIFLKDIHKTQRAARCAHCLSCLNICNHSHYRFS